jgi:hypothetical protein
MGIKRIYFIMIAGKRGINRKDAGKVSFFYDYGKP